MQLSLKFLVILATYTVAHALPGIGIYLIQCMIIAEPLSGLVQTGNGVAERDCPSYCGTYRNGQSTPNPFCGPGDRLIYQF